MSKFTPGPWKVFESSNMGLLLERKDEYGESYKQSVGSDADTLLMAQAPAMLKELYDVRELISEGAEHGFNPEVGDWAERLFRNNGKISKVINAATGKEK